MKKVKLTKIAQTDMPHSPAGDFKTYKLGQDNKPHFPVEPSLPVEYTIEGFLIKKIKVGEQITIQRTKRNDVELPGLFMSSYVQSIEGNIVHTMNSKYLVQFI